MNIKYTLLVLISSGLSVVSGFDNTCKYDIVESMPDGLDLKDPEGANITRTFDSLIEMVKKSQENLKIASFYWYLTAPSKFDREKSATKPGHDLMAAIKEAVQERGVKLQVVLNIDRGTLNNPDDIIALEKLGSVRFVNMSELTHAGVMHTKLLISDDRTFYLGSSNFDWRSYTEIKEMGLAFRDCPILASDLEKIFRTYVLVADTHKVPGPMNELKTAINKEHPLVLDLNEPGQAAEVFFASSPPKFNGDNDWTGRTDDIEALLYLIDNARHRISISVMNYSPRTEFAFPKLYWPRIDDALRRAATTRSVTVELLFSNWTNTRKSELAWYKSLNAIQSPDFKGSIQVKLFVVPAFNDYQKSVPFARVKHDKYMVTDKGVYLGTSNWSADYFISTAGISMVVKPHGRNSTLKIMRDFQAIFDRDFNSEYAHGL